MILLTFKYDSATLTVKAAGLEKDPLVPSLLKIIDVEGLEDSSAPEFKVECISIQSSDIVRYLSGSRIEFTSDTEEQEEDDKKPPAPRPSSDSIKKHWTYHPDTIEGTPLT